MLSPGAGRGKSSSAAWRLVALFPLAVTPILARAQQQPPRDSVPPGVVAPVVVTILRTPFEIATAPYAVASNGPDQVRRARPGLAADEALGVIPGVQVDNRYNFALGERISIRGFGARSQFGVRGLKVLVDGIPATLPDGQATLNHLDLATLDRVEVIRGPAAALYGNASGGVVQFESERAPDVEYEQSIRALWGSDALANLQASAAGTNGDRSYVLSVGRVRYGGFRAWDDADNWHINSLVRLSRARDSIGLVVNAVDYTAHNPGSLNDALLLADRTQAFQNNVLQQTGESGRQGQVGLTWNRTVGAGALQMAAHVVRRELDNPIPPRIIDLTRNAGGARAAFAAAVPGVPSAHWIAGAELQLQRDARTNHTNNAGVAGTLTLDQQERVTNSAVFLELTAQPTPRVDLLGGVRYDRLHFGVTDHLVSETDPDDSGDRLMDAVSPSLGVSVALEPGLHVYANAGTSFETPTTTELANRPTGAGGFNPDLDPQRTRSVEAGAKAIIGSHATMQVAVFRAGVRDALIPFEVPSFPGRVFYRNAGSAVHRGVEIGASAAAGPVSGQFSYAYIDATFDSYTVGTTDYAGHRIPGVSPHTAQARVSAAVMRRGFLDMDVRYASAVFADDANTARSPAYTTIGLRGGAEGLHLRGVTWSPFAGVTNLFDTDYNASVVINAAGSRYWEPAPGRAIYAGASLALTVVGAGRR
jgi:iron complex outermembrane recepter protein